MEDILKIKTSDFIAVKSKYFYDEKMTPFLKKYGIYVFLGCALILLLLRVNFSSMRSFEMILPNNIAATDTVSIGTHRHIRSDEWLLSSIQFNDLANNNKQFVDLSNGVPYGLAGMVYNFFSPLEWGNFFLPVSYAFSWTWIFSLMLSLYFVYRLFKIMTGSMYFSMFAAFLITYSPGVQWWTSPFKYGLYAAIAVLFYDFFDTDKIKIKICCCIGLVMAITMGVATVYPAWDVPMAYMILAMLVGIYFTKKSINIKKTDFIYIAATVGMIIFTSIYYFTDQREFIESVSQTVYPGARFYTGGDFFRDNVAEYFTHYLVAPFTPYRGITFLNQSEASSFLYLFPVPLLILALKWNQLKKSKVVIALAVFMALCFVCMIFGMSDFIAKYTMMSYSLSKRIMTLIGYASFILLLLEIYYINPIKSLKDLRLNFWIKTVILNSGVVGFLAFTYYKYPIIHNDIGRKRFALVGFGLILLANLMMLGRKKMFIALMVAVTFISGVAVNPVNFGVAPMTNTHFARQIRQIDEQDSGVWLALGNFILPKYVFAQGVDCINSLNYPPKLDMFRAVDPDGEHEDVYNRYGHMIANLTTEETKLELAWLDQILIELNIDDLHKWDVKYLAAQYDIEIESDTLSLSLVSFDELDGIRIYKVTYGN